MAAVETFCDHCGAEGASYAIERLTVPVASANVGESALLCRGCWGFVGRRMLAKHSHSLRERWIVSDLRREGMPTYQHGMYGVTRRVKPSKRPKHKICAKMPMGRDLANFVVNVLGVHTFQEVLDVYEQMTELRSQYGFEFGREPSRRDMEHMLSGWWPLHDGEVAPEGYMRLTADGREWVCVRMYPHGGPVTGVPMQG